MPIIHLPDLNTDVEFPDGMSQEEMSQAIDKQFYSKAPTTPTTESSIEHYPYAFQRGFSGAVGSALEGMAPVEAGVVTESPKMPMPTDAEAAPMLTPTGKTTLVNPLFVPPKAEVPLTPLGQPEGQTVRQRLGETWFAKEAAKRKELTEAIPTKPEASPYMTNLTEGAGGLTAGLASTLLTPEAPLLGMTAFGALTGAGGKIEEARAAGVEPSEAGPAVVGGALIGASQSLPLATGLEFALHASKLIPAHPLLQKLATVGVSAVSFTMQAALQKLGDNLLTKKYINPDQDVTEGVSRAALVGLGLGGITGAGIGVYYHINTKPKTVSEIGIQESDFAPPKTAGGEPSLTAETPLGQTIDLRQPAPVPTGGPVAAPEQARPLTADTLVERPGIQLTPGLPTSPVQDILKQSFSTLAEAKQASEQLKTLLPEGIQTHEVYSKEKGYQVRMGEPTLHEGFPEYDAWLDSLNKQQEEPYSPIEAARQKWERDYSLAQAADAEAQARIPDANARPAISFDEWLKMVHNDETDTPLALARRDWQIQYDTEAKAFDKELSKLSEKERTNKEWTDSTKRLEAEKAEAKMKQVAETAKKLAKQAKPVVQEAKPENLAKKVTQVEEQPKPEILTKVEPEVKAKPEVKVEYKLKALSPEEKAAQDKLIAEREARKVEQAKLDEEIKARAKKIAEEVRQKLLGRRQPEQKVATVTEPVKTEAQLSAEADTRAEILRNTVSLSESEPSVQTIVETSPETGKPTHIIRRMLDAKTAADEAKQAMTRAEKAEAGALSRQRFDTKKAAQNALQLAGYGGTITKVGGKYFIPEPIKLSSSVKLNGGLPWESLKELFGARPEGVADDTYTVSPGMFYKVRDWVLQGEKVPEAGPVRVAGRMYRQHLGLPQWTAKINSDYKQFYDVASKRREDHARGVAQAMEKFDVWRQLDAGERKDFATVRSKIEGKQLAAMPTKEIEAYTDEQGRELYRRSEKSDAEFTQWVSSKNLTQNVKDALVAWKTAMNDAFCDQYNHHVRSGDVDPATLKAHLEEVGFQPNYGPHNWYSDWYTEGKDASGKVVARVSLPDSMRRGMKLTGRAYGFNDLIESLKAQSQYKDVTWSTPQNAKELERFWMNSPIPIDVMQRLLNESASKIAQNPKYTEVAQAFINSIPDEMVRIIKTKGFSNFAERKGILGYETENLGKVYYDYMNGLYSGLAKMDAAKEYSNLMYKTKPSSEDYKLFADFVKDEMSPYGDFDKAMDKMRAFFFARYLGFRLKPALVNLTNMPVASLPVLGIYTDNPAALHARSAKDLALQFKGEVPTYRKTSGIFGLKEGNHLDDIRIQVQRDALTDSTIQHQMMNEYRGVYQDNTKFNGKLFHYMAMPMEMTEWYMRATTMDAAFQAMREGKITHQPTLDLYGLERGQPVDMTMPENYHNGLKFAEEIVSMAYGDYTQFNKPPVARGAGKGSSMLRSAYTFRFYNQHLAEMWNWMLRHEETGRGKTAFIKSIAAQGIIGGVKAIPGMSALMWMYEALMKEDPEDVARLKAGPDNSRIMDAFFEGAPALGGVYLGGSLEVGFPTNVQEAIGVPTAVVQDVVNSVNNWTSGNKTRALEVFAPLVVMRDALSAYRGYTSGERTVGGRPVNVPGEVEPRTLGAGEAVAQLFGIRPLSTEKAHRLGSNLKDLAETQKTTMNKFADRMNNAMVAGDDKELVSVYDELIAWNMGCIDQNREELIITNQAINAAMKERQAARQPGRQLMGRALETAEGYGFGQDSTGVMREQQIGKPAIANSPSELPNTQNLPSAPLFNYLKDKGVVNDVQQILGSPSSGLFTLPEKNVRVIGKTNPEFARSGAHEGFHAIKVSELPSRTQQIIDSLDSVDLDKLVTPEDWLRHNPYAKAKENTPVNYKLSEYKNKIFQQVTGNIPKGEEWSGLTNQTLQTKTGLEEAFAYYYTNPDVKGDFKQRTKEFAMYLRDRGVPWTAIDPLLVELRKAGQQLQPK